MHNRGITVLCCALYGVVSFPESALRSALFSVVVERRTSLLSSFCEDATLWGYFFLSCWFLYNKALLVTVLLTHPPQHVCAEVKGLCAGYGRGMVGEVWLIVAKRDLAKRSSAAAEGKAMLAGVRARMCVGGMCVCARSPVVVDWHVARLCVCARACVCAVFVCARAPGALLFFWKANKSRMINGRKTETE